MTARERGRQALELRISGKSFRAIGDDLGISEERARRCVARALESRTPVTRETAEQLRQVELERLDRYALGLDPAASSGDPKAVGAAVRLSERRARLCALDAPSHYDLTGRKGASLIPSPDRWKLEALTSSQRYTLAGLVAPANPELDASAVRLQLEAPAVFDATVLTDDELQEIRRISAKAMGREAEWLAEHAPGAIDHRFRSTG